MPTTTTFYDILGIEQFASADDGLCSFFTLNNNLKNLIIHFQFEKPTGNERSKLIQTSSILARPKQRNKMQSSSSIKSVIVVFFLRVDNSLHDSQP